MRIPVLFLSVLQFLLIVTPAIAQQDLYNIANPQLQYLWAEVLRLPGAWLAPNQFLFNFILPLIGLYAIVYGALRMMRIFTQNIRIVLAFVIVFLTLPSTIFVTFVQWTLAAAGVWIYLGFLFMIFVGWYWTFRGVVWRQEGGARVERNYARQMKHLDLEQRTYTSEKIRLESELEEVHDKLSKLNPTAANYYDQLNKLEGDATLLESRLRTLGEQLERTRETVQSLRRRQRTYRGI